MTDQSPPIEIERKFLVVGEAWREACICSRRIRQGYLEREGALTIRVRTVDDDQAFLTLKSNEPGAVRAEFEYKIPLRDAEILLRTYCRLPLIEKVRHDVLRGGQLWTIDVFEGDQQGLVLAEIELPEVDQEFEPPPWVGQEVTSDPAYRNSNM